MLAQTSPIASVVRVVLRRLHPHQLIALKALSVIDEAFSVIEAAACMGYSSIHANGVLMVSAQ